MYVILLQLSKCNYQQTLWIVDMHISKLQSVFDFQIYWAFLYGAFLYVLFLRVGLYTVWVFACFCHPTFVQKILNLINEFPF